MVEAEFSHPFPEQLFVGEHHAAVRDPAGSFHEILRAHTADDETKLVQMRLRADDHDHIPDVQLRLLRGSSDLPTQGRAMPRDDDTGFLNTGNLGNADTFEIRILHPQVHALQRLNAFALRPPKQLHLLRHIHLEEGTQNDE